MPKNTTVKGKALENYVAGEIERKGLGKASRSVGSGSGTREKSDIETDLTILGRNIGIECKNQKTACIPAWWKQTQALEKLDREPVLIYRLAQECWEETKVVIYLDTFLDLLKKSKEPKQAQFDESRKGKWIIQNAITTLKQLLKYLEGK